MERKELEKKDNKELAKILNEKRADLKKLRFDLAGGKVKDIKVIKGTKKDIARILTEMNSKKK